MTKDILSTLGSILVLELAVFLEVIDAEFSDVRVY